MLARLDESISTASCAVAVVESVAAIATVAAPASRCFAEMNFIEFPLFLMKAALPTK